MPGSIYMPHTNARSHRHNFIILVFDKLFCSMNGVEDVSLVLPDVLFTESKRIRTTW
jgi:hypothetical protein